MTRTQRTAGAALVVLAVAGCGGGNGEEAAPTASPTAAQAATSEPSTESSTPGSSPTPSASAEPSAEAGETYVIAEGDTLTAIAERFGTTVDAIVEANDIDDPDLIVVGEELSIPQQS